MSRLVFSLVLLAAILVQPTTPASADEAGSRGAAVRMYEVMTHQLMGVSGAERSVNLAHLLDDFSLKTKVYSRTFPNRAQSAFPRLVTVTNSRAIDLIGAGAILEDDDFRFFRHFFDPVNNQGLDSGVPGVYSIARDWGFDGAGEDNEFSWTMAFDYHKQSLVGTTTAERDENQEMFFVTLGHVVHLVQDCLQPSHTRDDPHGGNFLGGISELESWGSQNIRLGNITPDIRTAITSSPATYFNTYAQYFNDAASFSNGSFFSDDTILTTYPNPSTGNTSSVLETVPGQTFNQIFRVSSTLTDPVSGAPTRLARTAAGVISFYDTLMAPNGLVVEDNAQHLISRGVSRSRGLMDHFLRGRLMVTLDDQTNQLVVTNNSDLTVVNAAADLVFSGGQFETYYETVDGTILAVAPPTAIVPLQGSLAAGSSMTLPGDIIAFLDSVSMPGLPPNVRSRTDRRIIVYYDDGNIGVESGVAAGRVTINNNISLLLSFDVSGSLSVGQLDSAKNAALNLLPILSNGASNRVSVHAFSTSVTVLVPFTNNFDQASSVIQGLNPGGLTALNDAITVAGTSASAESAMQSAQMVDQRVIVILFTDGLENNSSSTQTQAVNAISRVGHPEIDEVFLVFVGTANGSQNLSNIAAQAGRSFFASSQFSALSSAFLNFIQN